MINSVCFSTKSSFVGGLERGLHYIKVALRNIIKYSVQNVVSILAIAVSVMLLTVVGSLLSKFFYTLAIEQTEHFDRTCVLPLGMLDADMRREVAQRNLKSAEHVMFGTLALNGYDLTATRKDGTRRRLDYEANGIQADLLTWWGERSVISGEVVKPLKDNEVYLSQQLAQQLYGDDFGDLRGQFIEVTRRKSNGSPETRQMKIADVVKVNETNGFVQHHGMYVAVDFNEYFYPHTVCIVLRQGCSVNDLHAELSSFLDLYRSSDDHIVLLRQQLDSQRAEMFLVVIGIIAFLILFVVVTVVGYIRMQAQLFRIREREIALRTVVGAKRWQILVQLSTEVLLVLGMAMVVTLVLNTLMKKFLNEHLARLVFDAYWTMDDFTPITLIIYAIAALLCLAAVAVVVRRIRRMQTGLAMRMRPQRRSGLQVATMTVQVLISTCFIAATLLFLFGSDTMKEQYNIPENDDFYGQCFVIRDTNVDGKEICEEFYKRLKACEDIEQLIEVDESAIELVMGSFIYKYCSVYFQTPDNEMMKFFGIEPTISNPHANPDSHVYVSRETKESMERSGEWQRGYVVTDYGEHIDIAGWFESIPYKRTEYVDDYIFWTRADSSEAHSYLIAIPRPHRYSAAMREVKAIYAELMPERFSLGPKNFRNAVCENYIVMHMMINIIYIIAAISIITTVASLYSVISLDTRRRRKEVALRKVHGATRRDILRLFATRYVVILTACFLLVAPLTSIATDLYNTANEAHVVWWQVFLATIALIIAIVVITIGWKIHDIARIQPAKWLKE